MLNILEEADARLRLGRVSIAKKKLSFLGMIVSKNGRSIKASFAEAVQKAKRPTFMTELRSFLGMCG